MLAAQQQLKQISGAQFSNSSCPVAKSLDCKRTFRCSKGSPVQLELWWADSTHLFCCCSFGPGYRSCEWYVSFFLNSFFHRLLHAFVESWHLKLDPTIIVGLGIELPLFHSVPTDFCTYCLSLWYAAACWFPFTIRLYYGFSSSIGSNFFLDGHIMTISVPAKKIWVDASSKMELRMTITGKDIGFRSEGSARCLSQWIDSTSLSSLTFWRNGQEEDVDAVMTTAPYSKGFSLR